MKIVFCDVDGTFQGLGNQLPKGNKAAVQQLQQQGHRFVFVTGRGLDLMTEFMAETELECDLIYANGAGIKRHGEAPLIRHPLAAEQVAPLLAFLDAHQVLYFVHTTKNIVMRPLHHYRRQLEAMEEAFLAETSEGSAIAAYKQQFFEASCQHEEAVGTYLSKHSENQVMKIELLEPDRSRLDWLRAQLADSGAYVFQSYYATLEIVDPRSTKGAAIKEYVEPFRQQEGVQTYGIGDGENDITMWENVDVPVAVANASAALKEHVDFVTGSCEEGGVGQFIQEILFP